MKNWLELRKGSYESPRTEQREKLDVRNLSKLFPKVKVSKLTPVVIKTAYAENAPGFSSKTLYQPNKRLRQILEDAVEDDIIQKNPAKKVRLSAPEPEKKDYLNAKFLRELRRIILQEPLSANIVVIQILLHTGMRPGEVFGLSWRDVRFAKCTISVNFQYPNDMVLRAPKSKASRDNVPINCVLYSFLFDWKCKQAASLEELGMDQTGETPVITNDVGGRLDTTSYSRWFRNFCSDHGFGVFTKATKTFVKDGKEYYRGTGHVGLGPNMFCDILPTQLIGTLGVDPKTASKMLRHQGMIVTAQHYVHTIEKNQYAASAAYANMLTSDSSSTCY